ncbi:transcriptional regulator, ArsR family [Aurantimonas manganoxydans SI85-9A1]|uniref:Transcriptional regulator, ArsR family n=1 Tax=Aurantimonas manganoxydans (strain ATCC BAA-1229 / DSM 21871 / SI85-9A1) TaxID=287752 RepID=Q1YM36_AURMS|nr:metalloregulator ArsR/SmtB family transcription factor [Aurantimonas manganoxydans]EAS51545.1 transcriptional regulator, ArsR family [Aurantimonas manganoxydans SI85-9A1]
MLDIQKLSFGRLVDALKAVAEPTRLRLVLLLARSDLTVSDLTAILGQSQPRISRHLKLLVESGVLTRYQEGAWAYFRLSEEASVSGLVHAVLNWADEADPVVERDSERLDAVRVERARRAADYFARNAGSWDTIRALHASDAEVEQALLAALGNKRIGTLLDVGTGTGRMLEVLAPRCERAVGIDASREMLAIARAKLDSAGIGNAVVRQGEAYHLPVERQAYDLVTIHQVLHYLEDPQAAVAEAARAVAPGGRLAIIDFAPHELEFLRAEHAHLRLGFSDDTLAGYLDDAGLELVSLDHLVSSGDETGELTVTICIARDPRLLVAGDSPNRTTLVS